MSTELAIIRKAGAMRVISLMDLAGHFGWQGQMTDIVTDTDNVLSILRQGLKDFEPEITALKTIHHEPLQPVD